jgi:hypothetical protein
MLKILENSRWQFLQLAEMGNESLLELGQMTSGWFRVNSLFDITVEILGWIEFRRVRRQQEEFNLFFVRGSPLLHLSTAMYRMLIDNPQQLALSFGNVRFRTLKKTASVSLRV